MDKVVTITEAELDAELVAAYAALKSSCKVEYALPEYRDAMIEALTKLANQIYKMHIAISNYIFAHLFRALKMLTAPSALNQLLPSIENEVMFCLTFNPQKPSTISDLFTALHKAKLVPGASIDEDTYEDLEDLLNNHTVKIYNPADKVNKIEIPLKENVERIKQSVLQNLAKIAINLWMERPIEIGENSIFNPNSINQINTIIEANSPNLQPDIMQGYRMPIILNGNLERISLEAIDDEQEQKPDRRYSFWICCRNV